MAQTKKKRRRKHRGTQGGSIDRRRKPPRSRQEARAQARRRQQVSRRDRPPTWRSAFNRAALMSAILFALLVLAFGRPAGASAVLALTMLAIYIPAGYFLERFLFNRRMALQARARRKQAERSGRD